jgi:hypothetical protein
MKVIKSGTGNDYAIFSADAVEAAQRQAHALGIKLYRQQSNRQPAKEQEHGIVHILRDDLWEEPLELSGNIEDRR